MKLHPIESAISSSARTTGPWLVCVSGGADSVALLRGCLSAGVQCRAAHCNFRLRGEESDRDEAFVRALCHRHGVPLECISFDTAEYCRTRGLSLEMGCRELRYAWFRQLVKAHRLSRIAVAHNADDDTETMLLNLLRGTGIRGLCGMQPDSGEIVRPLLSFTRAEIEAYLRGLGQEWITDSSNLVADVKRNFLRLEVLPLLRQKWPGLDKALVRTRRHLSGTAAIEQSALSRLAEPRQPLLPAEILDGFPAPEALIHHWLGALASPVTVAEMAASAPGARWELEGFTVARTAKGLHLSPSEGKLPALRSEYLQNSPQLLREIRADRSNEAFYCPETEGLTLRFARADDRISPWGMRGSTPVFKLLKEAGIPAPQRQLTPVLADAEDRVLWVPGLRRSALLPVSEDTPTVLKITIK